MSATGERMVFLDTETTGLRPEAGDRIVEIGAIGCTDRKLRDSPENRFHERVDPEREIPEEAVRIHGIATADVRGKPKFAAIAAGLVEFVSGAEVVMHNASFDCGFLDRELADADLKPLASYASRIVDSLKIARQMYPNSRNDLDSLCLRLGVDARPRRHRHSALVDAQLLARAYLLMTGGQRSLILDVDAEAFGDNMPDSSPIEIISWRADEMSIKLHCAYLEQMQKHSGVAPLMLRGQR